MKAKEKVDGRETELLLEGGHTCLLNCGLRNRRCLDLLVLDLPCS